MNDRKLNILIADDEEGLRLSMAGILELEGHRVVTAADGYQAIEMARQNTFDIAFLDIKMPGINGVEAFKEIKKLNPGIVVIMMTAFAVSDLIKEAIQEGAYACINKPFDMDRIIDTIKEVADKPFVLVIDQDPALGDQLYNRLQNNGCTVVIRSSGMEGLELAQRKVPDIIFLDVVMEQMDGIKTLKKLKELLGEKCPRIVIVSSQDLPQEFDEAQRLGAVECLRKPLDLAHVQKIIAGNKGKKARVCIVDDDKLFCSSLKEALGANGYDVDVANSGNELIDKIQHEAFKALIVDIRLPDIDGIEVFEKIKNMNDDMGVIFISNVADDEHLHRLRKNNYTYLYKPFEPDVLIKMIETIEKERARGKKPSSHG